VSATTFGVPFMKEDHYHRALAAHALTGEPFEQARTHLLLGEHLRRNRRRSEARAHLQTAVHAFDWLGASPWSVRAGQELRAAGGQPGGVGHESSGDVSALTPQERAVALAVASGMSNREVAETLFLSPRTVEYHLGNVYRKLGVHGRGALARALDSAPAPAPAPSAASG
jgi:DNA-binding CsgD family transcriptional regulator